MYTIYVHNSRTDIHSDCEAGQKNLEASWLLRVALCKGSTADIAPSERHAAISPRLFLSSHFLTHVAPSG
jgi:hypothetical protein